MCETKGKGPARGTLTFGLTHRFTITSSTSTIWFPSSLSYTVNHLVFKVNHMVQGQPYGSRSNVPPSRSILLSQTQENHTNVMH